jgi:hypothetical protein
MISRFFAVAAACVVCHVCVGPLSFSLLLIYIDFDIFFVKINSYQHQVLNCLHILQLKQQYLNRDRLHCHIALQRSNPYILRMSRNP